MITLGLVRKIGKMLRGGAGRKEIFLGAFCGVLIGFNPTSSLTLAFAILITLLLNANIGFTLLGVALGKLLGLAIAPISFHTGYFIIHTIGLEGLFATLANAPVTALMDLDVYAMVGGLPYALVIGVAFGVLLGSIVTKIRIRMLKTEQLEIVGKTLDKKATRFLLWLAFGKQKLSLEDVIAKQAPLFRKSGLILVVVVVAISLVLELFLFDIIIKSSLRSAIGATTGAEVDIGKAHLSLAGGKLELENLQITDPDKPTHNLVQIDTLAADISINDLLRDNYVVELLAGGTLKRDVLRKKPGAVYPKPAKEKEGKIADQQPGKELGDYFAQAKEWESYGEKAYEYLDKRRASGEAAAKGERPKASKEAAVADAKNLGYLKASANLVASRPSWTIRKIEIDQVLLGGGYPAQKFQALEVSSHPALNGKPTSFVMTPVGGTIPTAKLVLRFDNPAALHGISANFTNVALGGAVETSGSFPLDISGGKADIKASGTFSADALQVPFTVVVHDLKADVAEGKTVMGMDGKTATEVFSSMETLEIDGTLGGSLLAPRIQIDYDKLAANMKQALLAAGKKELANRANAEVDKAKDELKKQAGGQIDKLLGGEDGASTEDKAKGMLKKLF